MTFENMDMKRLKKAKELWEKEYNNVPKREEDFTTISGMKVPPLVTPQDLNGFDYAERFGIPRLLSVHARYTQHDVPGPALDHASVCRLRDARGHEPEV